MTRLTDRRCFSSRLFRSATLPATASVWTSSPESADTSPSSKRLRSSGSKVSSAYRGHGLGTRLLSACIEKAWRKGLTRIELEAREDNEAAISLYAKLGFKREALKANAMRFDGVYFNAVQMRLLRGEV